MAVTAEHLTHIYSEGQPHEQIALEDVSFHVEDGAFVGIIGHTGSGKSTLLQHMNGLLKPKSGRLIIGDTDITGPGVSMLKIRRRTGLVFQYPEYQLFEETVAKDVAFGPENLGLSPEETDARVREAIELVGLDYDEIKNVSPFELSGGQKRRVAIAGVIAMKPEILILDEPTAGLNPRAHQEILDMVCRIHEEEGNITFLVSHNMNDIARLADQVLVIDHGRLVMDGTPAEVFARGEELEWIGLARPDSLEIFDRLQQEGVLGDRLRENDSPAPLTLEAAADLIAGALAAGGCEAPQDGGCEVSRLSGSGEAAGEAKAVRS